MKRLIRSAKRPSSACRHSIDSKRSCWSSMKTTDSAKRRWVRWISRFRTKNRRLKEGLAAWSVNRRSLSRLPMKRKIQMSWRCKRISSRRSSGLPTWRPKWKRKWSRISSMRMLSRRSVRRLVTLTSRRLSRNSWPVSQLMLSCSCRSQSKRRKSMRLEMITSSGAKSFTNFKFRIVTRTLRPTGQARFRPSWTL